PDGGWGYAPGQLPHLEPTCLALLALPDGDHRKPALAGVETNAAGDGTYRLERGRREAAWPTALVLFTRLSLGDAGPEPSARALLALRGQTIEADNDSDVNDVDSSLVGWPWAEGNFSWVEPTAWAMLALRKAGQGDHPRVAEGRRLLLDRVLETGGLNYGNRRIFGVTLEPIPTPTAVALLALQGTADPRIDATLDYLEKAALAATDVEHLGWSILALDALGRTAALGELRRRLTDAVRAREQTPYVRPAPLRAALACLALDAGVNPFRLGAAAAAALQPGSLSAGSKPLGQRVQGWVQGLAVFASTSLKQLPPSSDVHIAPAADYSADLVGVMARQYEHYRARVPLKGKRVVLKPNLVEYHRDKVINTDPRFVAAAIELCQREGAAEVIVAEGPGHWRNVEHLVKESGLGDVLRTYGVPFIDINHDEPVRRVNLGRLTKLEHLYLSRTVLSADVLISLPRLKTHHWAVATLSLKNLFGTMPGVCYGWPKNELHWRGIDNSIVDIAATRTPDLAIVDGIVGMEGDGPLNGAPKPMGVIIMGDDLVAVDATCCRLMKLDPEKVAYLVLAHRKKVGVLADGQIRQVGEAVADRAKPFATVPGHSPVWIGPRD
ncbi:MAG: DUF362 domain-containing protein, partial [Gemmataceae bacterium]